MDNFKEKFIKLKDEFETYQSFAEKNIQTLTEKNIIMEKNLDALTNIVEVSKYINSYLGDSNLITMINDMMIGILGVTYSTIYIVENDELDVKATNKTIEACFYLEKERYDMLKNGESFVINTRESIYYEDNGLKGIHSLIGVPIKLREKFIGYIIVEHTLWNFFGSDHIKFISSIANQIAIALENNFLYNKVKESSIKDPLMGIYNRKYFFNKVSQIIEENKDRNFCIVMMDMDNFKSANDTYGHQFGDEVLRKTCEILRENIDDNDIVARYGGEEIVIYVHDVKGYKDIYKKVDNIRHIISNNVINYDKVSKSITASFGISFYPEDGKSLEAVLSVADIMLYRAKAEGRNRVIASHSN